MLRKLRFYLAYLHKPVWDTGISPPELVDFIASHPPGRALDLGCGTGTNAITLANHGWDVIGVDFARIAIHQAKVKARQQAIEIDFRVGDVTKLDGINGLFDLILDVGCFTSLAPDSRPEYIKRIDWLLAMSGTYLTYLFYKETTGDNKPGVTEVDIQSMMHRFHLVERKDGTERGLRPSVWLTFHKNLEPSLVKVE